MEDFWWWLPASICVCAQVHNTHTKKLKIACYLLSKLLLCSYVHHTLDFCELSNVPWVAERCQCLHPSPKVLLYKTRSFRSVMTCSFYCHFDDIFTKVLINAHLNFCHTLLICLHDSSSALCYQLLPLHLHPSFSKWTTCSWCFPMPETTETEPCA